MKKDEFKKIFGTLISLYPNANIGKETFMAYWDRLKDCDANILKSAAVKASDESDFFPSVAMLKRLIIDEIYDIPTEADVINDLFSRISSTGIYGNPTFEYPITNALVEELDWKTINNMTPEDVIKSIHFRYTSVSDHYERCLLRGENFPINKIKGLFAEIERKPFLKNGNNIFRQVVDNIKIKEN